MKVMKGIPASPGIAICESFLLDSESYRITKRLVRADEVPGEVQRFERAVVEARAEAAKYRQSVALSLGATASAPKILEAHEQMLADPYLVNQVKQWIEQRNASAEWATSRAVRKIIKDFKTQAQRTGNPRLADLDKDLLDIEARLLRCLLGERRAEVERMDRERIIIAKDLTPTQTAALDRDKVRGIATEAGGRTSHTAIVARNLGIPAVVGLGRIVAEVDPGDLLIIDGGTGTLVIQPDERTLQEYQKRREQFRELVVELKRLVHLPCETLDAYAVGLSANIEFPEEIHHALENGAQGIGLFRTEFLFSEETRIPTEEEHFRTYKRAVEILEGRPLTIRTLDLGGDKYTIGIGAPEKNPFLGCRSIRLCFRRPELWKPQLRAILRASALGKVRIMFPMIASLDDVREAKKFLYDAMDELKRERVPFDEKLPIGVMIEVPSAAVVADLLSKEVDFFSIGTNDLVQYTLAVDRINEKVAHLYQPAHPAILRLLAQVIEAGARAGISVSMCGEVAGEAHYTIPLLGLGLRELSVGAGSLPEVKRMVRSVAMRDARRVVERIMKFTNAREIEAFLRGIAKKSLPELVE